MKISHLRHSRAGFTLLELIIAMSIFMLMSSMAFLIYFNISETSRRLQISRELSESSRQVTEYISDQIRENGVAIRVDDHFEENSSHEFWKQNFSSEYSAKGSEVLPLGIIEQDGIRKTQKFVVYGKKNGDFLRPCTEDDKNDVQVHCGVYVVEKRENGEISSHNLIDTFRAEDRKRIKVTDFTFYISAEEGDAVKVTLVMTLELMPREWVPVSLIRNTKMKIQTTFSERPYKIQ